MQEIEGEKRTHIPMHTDSLTDGRRPGQPDCLGIPSAEA